MNTRPAITLTPGDLDGALYALRVPPPELVRLAREHDAQVAIAAQTLPERNVSHRVLEKLGFRRVAALAHPEDGLVWEWRAPSA